MNAHMEQHFRTQMIGLKSRRHKHAPSAEGVLVRLLLNRDYEAAAIVCRVNEWEEPETVQAEVESEEAA